MDWESLDWGEFEQVVAKTWEGLGCRTWLTDDGADGGVDVIAVEPSGRQLAIQTKCNSRQNKVGVRKVREYSSLLHREKFDEVIIVTASSFTRDAKAEAESLDVQLIDREAFSTLFDGGDVLGLGDIELLEVLRGHRERLRTSDKDEPFAFLEFYTENGPVGYQFTDSLHNIAGLTNVQYDIATCLVDAHGLAVIDETESAILATRDTERGIGEWRPTTEVELTEELLERIYRLRPPDIKFVEHTRVE